MVNMRYWKLHRFLWYLTLVTANHASSNSGQIIKFWPKLFHNEVEKVVSHSKTPYLKTFDALICANLPLPQWRVVSLLSSQTQCIPLEDWESSPSGYALEMMHSGLKKKHKQSLCCVWFNTFSHDISLFTVARWIISDLVPRVLSFPFPGARERCYVIFCHLPDYGRHVTSVFQGLSPSRSREREGEDPGNEVE